MYLQCTGQVYGGYIIHFLAMYLQCTGPVHHPLPPVTDCSNSTFDDLFVEDLVLAARHVGCRQLSQLEVSPYQ